MGSTGLFQSRTRRHQIDEVAARLDRRKRALVSHSSRLGETLYGKLTSPGAFIIAGSAGYLIGELSRPRAGTERSPIRNRPLRSLFDDASLWLKTAVALVNWTHAMFVAPVEPLGRVPGAVPQGRCKHFPVRSGSNIPVFDSPGPGSRVCGWTYTLFVFR